MSMTSDCLPWGFALRRSIERECTCPAHAARGDGWNDEDCPVHGDHEGDDLDAF